MPSIGPHYQSDLCSHSVCVRAPLPRRPPIAAATDFGPTLLPALPTRQDPIDNTSVHALPPQRGHGHPVAIAQIEYSHIVSFFVSLEDIHIIHAMYGTSIVSRSFHFGVVAEVADVSCTHLIANWKELFETFGSAALLLSAPPTSHFLQEANLADIAMAGNRTTNNFIELSIPKWTTTPSGIKNDTVPKNRNLAAAIQQLQNKLVSSSKPGKSGTQAKQ
eukprot:1852172-Amphidinium_carterae.3